MPTYDYVCEACGHEFEHFQSMSDRHLRTCPKCKKRRLVRKIGAGAGLIFKGTGFYQTDYKAPASSPAKSKGETGGDSSTGESSSGSASSNDKGAAGDKSAAGDKGASGDKGATKSAPTSDTAKAPAESKTSNASKSSTPAKESGGGKQRSS